MSGAPLRRRQAGVNLVELVIAIVVAASILTAIAVVGLQYRREIVSYLTHWKGSPTHTEPYVPFPTGDLPAVRLAVVGDVGDSGSRLQRTADGVARLAGSEGFDGLLLLGDNVYPDGDPEQLRGTVLEPFAPILARGALADAGLTIRDVDAVLTGNNLQEAQMFIPATLIEYLGIDPEPVEWRINITPEERAQQSAFFEPLGRTCAIVVGTSKPAKNWAPNRYARVIEALERESEMLGLLRDVAATDLSVTIGAEHPSTGEWNAALVAAPFGSGETPLGTIAVVGPTRMDYLSVMASVRAVARRLSY